MRGLAGKIAAVTGGGSGIGQAISIRLAEEGCKVAILDWKPATAEATVATIRAAGGDALAVGVDLGKEPEVTAAFAVIRGHYGRLDILCPNAAIFDGARDGPVDQLALEVWHEFIASNLTGMFLACKHGVALMRDTAGKGAVVITGSPTGMSGCTPAVTAYGTSKGGVHGLARIMAVDYAPHGIRVNVVVPGFTLSPLTVEIRKDPEFIKWLDRAIPMNRGAEPSEVAAAVAFLASEDASYMTGSFLYVDGGLTSI